VIVDGHAHVFRAADISPRGVDALAPAQRDAPVEELLSVLAEHGVGAAVLVPLDEHDDYVRDVMRAHPRRFAAVAVAAEDLVGPVGSVHGVGTASVLGADREVGS